ncbi:MAG: hypothetical protein M3R01_03665 [Actinomycetota bacterium]|nr:hypothetical protein [Actinomycetota bacterium]
MTIAGIRVSDYETAKAWYERLLGSEPSFIAHETEAVWEPAEYRSIFIVEEAGWVAARIQRRARLYLAATVPAEPVPESETPAATESVGGFVHSGGPIRL